MAERLLPTLNHQGTLPPARRTEKLAQLDDVVELLSKVELPAGTKSAYKRALARFEAWCAGLGLIAVPASVSTIERYVAAAITEGIPSLNGDTGPIGYSTIRVHLAAIRFVHVHAGHPDPVESLPEKFVVGLRKQARAPEQKEFLTQDQLHRIVASFDSRLKGLRDKALLLVAFYSGGRRRSEIANMQREELRFVEEDWIWTIEKTKTRKGVEPLVLGIPQLDDERVCPARALSRWLDTASAAGADSGPVFTYVDKYNRLHPGKSIQPHVVANIIKAAAKGIGLNAEQLAGHSLRSGFATWATKKGIPMEQWMKMTDHRSYSVASRYQRWGQMLGKNNPVRKAFDSE